MSPHDHTVTFAESQQHVINATNPCRAFHDCIQHWLHIRGRAADDAEHLGRCCLMFQGFTQFGIALLDFLKQANILDRDDRLRGKGFEQCYLLVGKGLYLGAANVDHPDGGPFPQQRRHKKSSSTAWVGAPYTVRKLLYLSQYVYKVDRPALEQGFVAHRAPRHGSPFRVIRWNRSVVRRQDRLIAFEEANSCVVGSAPPCRVLRNRIEHRLNSRWRASDDSQDLARRGLLLQRLLEFLKQPHVLDGNYRLVGESLEQLDLRRGEGAHFGVTCGQY